MVMHYAPTANRTMCGKLITDRVHWIGSFEDWLTDLAQGHQDTCSACAHTMRRFPRLYIPLAAALFKRRARIDENGGTYVPRPPAQRMG